jgi:MFS family permease
MFKTWIRVLIKPDETFRKEKSNAEPVKLIKIICAAGIIAAVMYAIIFTLFNIPAGFFGSSYGFSGKIIYVLIMMFWLPVNTIICLAILSVILYVFAKIFRGSGNLTTQAYLTALFTAPLIIISTLFTIPSIGAVASAVIIPYSLYLLTLALRETHGTTKAVLTWLIPLTPVILIVLFLMLSLFSPHTQVDVHNIIINKSVNP